MESEEHGLLELALRQIGESYGHLRFIHPPSERAMVESMGRYGQLTPVVVAPSMEGGYELVDGFKRLRACQKLGIGSLKATVLEVGRRSQKAAMIQLNWKARSMGKLEEAMVLHSLVHDDGLTQLEVASLLGRHKSWVSRRISLVERLCEELLDQMRLGLLSATLGRELARLPRGNQQAALATIRQYHFTTRESARLVSILLERPRWEGEAILRFPHEILDDRSPPRPREKAIGRATRSVLGKLMAMERSALWISKRLESSPLSQTDRLSLASVVGRIDQTVGRIKTQLGEGPWSSTSEIAKSCTI
jgi:ParB/RepB/Spo0J family partition protein